MSNKVQIGVDANVSGVEASLNKVEAGAADVSKSFGDIGKATEKAAAGIGKVEYSAKRLQAIAAILHKEFGKAFDPKQAEAFIRNFDSIRNNKHVSGSSKLRAFNSFESWHSGNSSMFVNPAEAERYRRRVLGLAGQGIGLPHGGHGSGGGGNGVPPIPSGMGGMASKGMSGMGKVAGAGLALAGVGSVMAMAGRAVDLAKQEATNTDQLLRKSGDLSQSFDSLREKVRASGDGLGVLFVESAALGKKYVEMANGTGGDIGGNLRTGFGLSRAYGLELGEGVGFMAQMRHQGQVSDKDGKKFALLIAEAIEKGQTTGKAGEVLQAVSNFSSQVAKLALTPGNVAGFGGALAGLTSSSDIGMKGDPSNAAALLMNVDSSIRRGGNMGEASLNFQYGALSRQMPGLDPIMAKAIMEQGAFGSGVSSSIKTYAGRNGIKLPDFSKSDNLSIMMDEMDKQYGNSSLKLDAIKNHFGLGSYGQAAALANLDRKELTGLQNSGIDPNSIKASSLQNVGRIGIANDDELKAMAGKLTSGNYLNQKEQKEIKAKLDDGDMKGLRESMLKAVSIREQEKNVGTETRDGVNAMHNALTQIGASALPILSGIQEGVAAIVGVVAPKSAYAEEQRKSEGLGKYKSDKADLLAKQADQRAKYEQSLKNDDIDEGRRKRMMLRFDIDQEYQKQNFEKANPGMADYERTHKDGGAIPIGDQIKKINGIYDDQQKSLNSEPLDLGPLAPNANSSTGGPDGKKQSFLKQYEEYFKGAGSELGVSPKVLASQFALETNWGKSVIPGTNNLGNIKATGWNGRTANAKDNMLGTTDSYRAYDSLKESAADYAKLIKRNYPDALNAGDDPEAFARALQNGRGGRQYAEDPDYAKKLKQIHRNLPAEPFELPRRSKEVADRAEEAEKRDGVMLGKDGGWVKRRADSFTGDVPSGNPAGSPAQTQKIELTLEGMMRDSQHQQVADIAQIQHTISIPTAAGATG